MSAFFACARLEREQRYLNEFRKAPRRAEHEERAGVSNPGRPMWEMGGNGLKCWHWHFSYTMNNRELTRNLKSWRFGSDDFDLFNWGDFLGSKL